MSFTNPDIRGKDADPAYPHSSESSITKNTTPQNIIRFDIPPTLRQFCPFPRLPAELQDMIWQETFAEPGINFMNLVPELIENTSQWFIAPTFRPRTVAEEVAAEPETLRLSLCALEPVICQVEGDRSNYITLRKQVQKMLLISEMSQAFIRTQLKSKSILWDRERRVLSMNAAQDVFFINYINESDRHIGAGFNVQPLCAELHGIVQVAVRFNHMWKMPAGNQICPTCFRVHFGPSDKCHYPRHLYQFLARCFPNLEQVWIVDYHMRPKVEEGRSFKRAKPGSSSNVLACNVTKLRIY